MMNPLVSIIIPTYNRIQLLNETINSVIEQSYSNWVCLLIDDGSTDESKALLKKFVLKDKRILYFERPENRKKGANSCRNIGLEKSKGEFLIFLDSDDLLGKECIEDRIKQATLYPDYDFYVFNMERFVTKMNDSDELINKYPSDDTNSYLELFLSYNTPWQITSLFIKKESLDFNFDEDLQRFQDVLFSTKLLIRDKRYKVFKEEKADCFYRLTKTSLSRVNDTTFISVVNRSYIILLKRIVSDCESNHIDPDYKKYLAKGFLKIYKMFIFPKNRFFDFLGMAKLGIKYKLIPFKKVAILGILLVYNNLGLKHIKGLGYYKLSKILRQ